MLSVMLFENARSSIKNLGNTATGQWLAKKKLFKLNSVSVCLPGCLARLVSSLGQVGATGHAQRATQFTHIRLDIERLVTL